MKIKIEKRWDPDCPTRNLKDGDKYVAFNVKREYAEYIVKLQDRVKELEGIIK